MHLSKREQVIYDISLAMSQLDKGKKTTCCDILWNVIDDIEFCPRARDWVEKSYWLIKVPTQNGKDWARDVLQLVIVALEGGL